MSHRDLEHNENPDACEQDLQTNLCEGSKVFFHDRRPRQIKQPLSVHSRVVPSNICETGSRISLEHL